MSKDRNLDVLKAYHRFFDTVEGQAILYDLMEKGCFVRPCVDQIDEGKRQLVLYILENINRDVSELEKFIKDQENQRKEYLDANFDVD